MTKYEPIISTLIQKAAKEISYDMDKFVLEEIHAVGIDVNKEELIKALAYDRNQYEKGYQDGLNANRWIPVRDRLPTIDGNTSDTVLVCCCSGFQYMAFWCDDLQWRFCECGTAKEPVLWTEIIAWMPLPAPYKGGEDDAN